MFSSSSSSELLLFLNKTKPSSNLLMDLATLLSNCPNYNYYVMLKVFN